MFAARLSLLITFLTASAFQPDGAAAQVRDSVYSIGEITVTATRSGVEPARAPQRVTVLDQNDIQASASRSVADLVSARAGVFIRRQGQGLATVSQRGGGPSQTQLLIDGMRLSDPQLGQFDLSLLPAHLFRSVEILHGPGSALYGTDGMSGTIHLRPRRAEEDHLTVLTEAGAFGQRLASVGLSFTGGALSGLVSAEYSRADGDFPYVNHTHFPPREVRRANADREMRSLFATMAGKAGHHQLKGALLYTDSRQGVPGLVGSAPQGERRWDEHARLWIEDELKVGGGLLDLRAFAHHGTLRYRNPALELDETGRTMTAGVETAYRTELGSRAEVALGASGGYGSAEHPSLAASANELHGALFGSATAYVGRARIYPALRFDVYNQSDRTLSAVNPRLGLNVQLLPEQPIFAKLNAATGFRVPTFNDRFWQPGGNPDLKPERARSLDAGVFIDGRLLQAELMGYVSRYANQIVWTNESGDFWAPVNLALTRSTGVELSTELRPDEALTAGAVYTFTRAVDRSDPETPSYGRQLRYVPRHTAKAYVDAEIGRFHVHLGGQYLGVRFVASDESEHLEPVLTAEVQAAIVHSVGPIRGRLAVILENLLDSRYAVIQGYPMPPRHARLRLVLETR